MLNVTFCDFISERWRNGDEHGTAGNMSQSMPSVLAVPVLWLMCQS